MEDSDQLDPEGERYGNDEGNLLSHVDQDSYKDNDNLSEEFDSD